MKPHVPELVKLKEEEDKRVKDSGTQVAVLSEEALYAKAIERSKSRRP